MRKIKVDKWNVLKPDGSKGIEESTIVVLTMLINQIPSDKLPRGLDKFRLFGRLVNSFTNAEKTNIIWLEESDYSFLKKIIEKDIPGIWGMNPNILKTIDSFIEAKEGQK